MMTWKLGAPPLTLMGASLLRRDYFKDLPNLPPKFNEVAFLKIVFQMFQEELVIMIERLQLLYLESSSIVIPLSKQSGWGVLSERYQELKNQYCLS